MLRTLTSAASDSLRAMLRDAAREAVREMALFAAGLMLLATAAVFGEIALYLWLRTQMTGYLAALVVAGVALVLATLIGLFAAGSARGRRTARTAAAQAAHSADETPPARDPVAHLAAEAETLGKLLGGDARGYQLVLGAFVTGLMLGRDRRS